MQEMDVQNLSHSSSQTHSLTHTYFLPFVRYEQWKERQNGKNIFKILIKST